jgi:transposase-like protein
LADNDARFRAGEIQMSTEYHHLFDEVVRVNNVYNTIVIYEGRHFHAANQFFGKTLEDSRLTQVFFINKIDAQKQSVFPISRTQQIKI